jgi:hypothetical protein
MYFVQRTHNKNQIVIEHVSDISVNMAFFTSQAASVRLLQVSVSPLSFFALLCNLSYTRDFAIFVCIAP